MSKIAVDKVVQYMYFMNNCCTSEEVREFLRTVEKPIEFGVDFGIKFAYCRQLSNKKAVEIFDESEFNKIVEMENYIKFVKTVHSEEEFEDCIQKYRVSEAI